jgi:hypothetical protein
MARLKIEDYVATRGIAVRLSRDPASPDYEIFWEAAAGESLEDAPDHIDVQGLLDVEAICTRSTWEKAQATPAPSSTLDDPGIGPREPIGGTRQEGRQEAANGPDAQPDGISTPGGASSSSAPGAEDLNNGES